MQHPCHCGRTPKLINPVSLSCLIVDRSKTVPSRNTRGGMTLVMCNYRNVYILLYRLVIVPFCTYSGMTDWLGGHAPENGGRKPPPLPHALVRLRVGMS